MRTATTTTLLLTLLTASPGWAEQPDTTADAPTRPADGLRILSEVGFGTLGLVGGAIVGGVMTMGGTVAAQPRDGQVPSFAEIIPLLMMSTGTVLGTYYGGNWLEGNGTPQGTLGGFLVGAVAGGGTVWLVTSVVDDPSTNTKLAAVGAAAVMAVGGATIGYEWTDEPPEPSPPDLDIFGAPTPTLDGGTVGVRITY